MSDKKTGKTEPSTRKRETDAQIQARVRTAERRHTTTVSIVIPTWDRLLEVAAKARERGKQEPSANLVINALLRAALSNERTAIATIRASGNINLPRGPKK